MRQKTVITKSLQSVTEVYYKVCQVLQSASGITKCDRLLLQSVSGITKCDSYYKVIGNTCAKIKYSLSINYEKPNEKNLDYLKKVTVK